MNVILDTDRFSLIQGDSLEVLRSLADKSVDIIVTDPPYSEHTHAKLGKERRNDGHRVREGLTFEPMTNRLMRLVAREYVRVCKGWIVSFSDFYHSYFWGTHIRGAGGSWLRTGSWVKTNPMPQMTGDRPATGTEDIVIAHAGTRGFEWNAKGRAAVWRGARPATDGRTDHHPNAKPAWLMQSIIGMFCPPGGLVLDPYFGSGSTAVGAFAPERLPGESPPETCCKACAAKLLEAYQPPLPDGVRVIGVEGDQKYVAMSISRIRGTCPGVIAA